MHFLNQIIKEKVTISLQSTQYYLKHF